MCGSIFRLVRSSRQKPCWGEKMSKLEKAIKLMSQASTLGDIVKRVKRTLKEMWDEERIDEFISDTFSEISRGTECDYWWDSDGAYLDHIPSDEAVIADATALGVEPPQVEEALTDKFINKLEEDADDLKYEWELENRPERYLPPGHVLLRGR